RERTPHARDDHWPWQHGARAHHPPPRWRERGLAGGAGPAAGRGGRFGATGRCRRLRRGGRRGARDGDRKERGGDPRPPLSGRPRRRARARPPPGRQGRDRRHHPLDESYTGLVTEGGPSGAESIRSLLPPETRLVKAFNTTFARTLVAGEVSGQPL